jgi:LCP family protein required for cell wall assembly
MIASIDLETKKTALLSLPRDLYVTIPKTHLSGKINTLFQYGESQGTGLDPLKETLTDITGESIDYFFVVDFDGFEKVVDALGGVSVDSPKDFYDPRYPGKNFSFETFELKKGWQKLDGATALKYVRERHDDPEGDFGRAKRQQQVLQALKNKAFSPGTYLNFFRINKLFASVEDNVKTNITLGEMRSFYELSKTLDTENITNRVIDAWQPESLLRVGHVTLGGKQAFILVPRTGNWEEIRETSKNIFTQDALVTRQHQIEQEHSTLLILDDGETIGAAKKLGSYVERELGIKTEARYESSLRLKDSGEKGILISRALLTKPYSLDELLRRLPVTRSPSDTPSLGETSFDAGDADFVIIMDQALADTFVNADYFSSQTTEDQTSEVSTPLTPTTDRIPSP